MYRLFAQSIFKVNQFRAGRYYMSDRNDPPPLHNPIDENKIIL